MVTTNIVRRVDKVGRVSLPLSLRESLGFSSQDPLEMHAEGNCIVVQKHVASCFFCGGEEDLKAYRTFPICAKCRFLLKQEAAAWHPQQN